MISNILFNEFYIVFFNNSIRLFNIDVYNSLLIISLSEIERILLTVKLSITIGLAPNFFK